ncbi:hypothetical protein [Oleidesulfovibrio sp.]|uniref:hypothetical protein n=1 Tax=Oleidesulfovibrio sp. TaxID=2909707 RepID=UPI003A8BAD0C
MACAEIFKTITLRSTELPHPVDLLSRWMSYFRWTLFLSDVRVPCDVVEGT